MKEFKLNVEGLPKEVKEAIQRKAFELGYSWHKQKTGTISHPLGCHETAGIYTFRKMGILWGKDMDDSDLEELSLQEFFALKKEDNFKPGWYRDVSVDNQDDNDFCVEFDKNKKALWSISGYDWKGTCYNPVHEDIVFNWQPISHKELLEAFKREAEKRGFKDGVRVKDTHTNRTALFDKQKTPIYYDFDETLWMGGVCVWNEGKWAEIIEEEDEVRDFWEQVIPRKPSNKDLMQKLEEIHKEIKSFKK